jgi:hypothetical protein
MAHRPVGKAHVMSAKPKPTRLNALFGPEAAVDPVQPAHGVPPKAEPAKSQRPSVRQQTLYLPHPVYKQLRHIAFDEDTRMHSLVMEGLDRVFAARGLPSIEDLTRKS